MGIPLPFLFPFLPCPSPFLSHSLPSSSPFLPSFFSLPFPVLFLVPSLSREPNFPRTSYRGLGSAVSSLSRVWTKVPPPKWGVGRSPSGQKRFGAYLSQKSSSGGSIFVDILNNKSSILLKNNDHAIYTGVCVCVCVCVCVS